MATLAKRTRASVVSIALLLLTAMPASADEALDRAIEEAHSYRAFVFLVNGFTGCCVPGDKFRAFLKEKGAYVHESNWNEIDQKGNPGVPVADADNFAWKVTPSPPDDETFIKQMKDVIARIDRKAPSMPVILIGHSFGGDAVLQVAKRIGDRKIAFLAVLDGVGKGGLRKNITKPVPENVAYFFSRWQQNSPFAGDHMIPFDRLLSGKISSHAGESNQKKQNTEKTAKCKTKYRDPIKAIPQLLSHGEVPTDSCVQKKMKRILSERVLK